MQIRVTNSLSPLTTVLAQLNPPRRWQRETFWLFQFLAPVSWSDFVNN